MSLFESSSMKLVSPGKKYFHVNLKYLFVVGLWPNNRWMFNKPQLYKTYEIIMHILSLLYLVMTSIGTYTVRGETIILMSNIDKALAGYSFVLKVIFYKLNQNILQNLVSNIMFSGDKITKKCTRDMTNLLTFITVFIVVIAGAFSLSALYDGNMTVEAWMPFDPMMSKMNLLMAAQIIAVTFVVPCALRGMGLQGLVCSLIMYLCEQLKELQGRLITLTYVKEHDAEFRQQFKDIVKKHVRLMGYARTIKKSFEHFFLVHSFAMTIEMCLNALMVSVVGTQDIKTLVNFLAFLSIALINTFIYCHLGNEMIIQSEGVSLAAYMSAWTSWPVDLQRDLLIVIRVAQRPLHLSAGGMSVVSMQTYCQILYNGYSIFTMLHDMV